MEVKHKRNITFPEAKKIAEDFMRGQSFSSVAWESHLKNTSQLEKFKTLIEKNNISGTRILAKIEEWPLPYPPEKHWIQQWKYILLEAELNQSGQIQRPLQRKFNRKWQNKFSRKFYRNTNHSSKGIYKNYN